MLPDPDRTEFDAAIYARPDDGSWLITILAYCAGEALVLATLVAFGAVVVLLDRL